MPTRERPATVLYARFSPRPNAEECESIDTQLERLRTWANAVELEVDSVHDDEDKSGKDQNRPGLQRAIDRVCQIRGVLAVYSLSRLARNPGDAIEIVGRLDRRGADLASLNERIDTSTAMGEFFFHMVAALAQLEREQIVERTSDAMRRHQAAGRRMGRPDRCPYGYQVAVGDDAVIVPARDEQQVIELMRTARNRGMSFRGIGAHLDELGYRRRKGQRWSTAPALISKILKRESSHS
jgi:site-specific DNA recombinase